MTDTLRFGCNLYSFTRYNAPVSAIAAYTRLAESLGFNHVRVLDHVVGIVADRHGGIAQTPYTNESQIREPFTLLAYLAGLTDRIGLMTGVIALPMRQAVLVAKQAAEIDIISGGRLTLGVGIGYNAVEFEAMGASFGDRARRFEEQIALMRRLWTEDVVSFQGDYHKVSDTSLSPLPIQRPIPVWIGLGRVIKPISPDPVLRRVGRLADGWLPLFKPDAVGRKAVETMREGAIEAGRDPDTIRMEMSLYVENKSTQQLVDEARVLQAFGANRLNVMLPGDTPEDEMEAMKRFREVMDRF